jgi:hypothetical protein
MLILELRLELEPMESGEYRLHWMAKSGADGKDNGPASRKRSAIALL